MLVGACARAGFEPNVAFESDDHNVLVGLVASGVGVALLPELALRTPHPGVAIRPVLGSTTMRRIHAAVAADAYRSPATEAMIEVLCTVSERFRSGSSAAAA
jgi:DNA-binding transcriptional LysR family regulator